MKRQVERSINTDLILITVLFMGITAIATAFLGYRFYHKNVMDEHIKYTYTVLNYAYRETEKYKLGDMITNREMTDDYTRLRDALNNIKECSEIQYLYGIFFENPDDTSSLRYSINAKTQEELAGTRLLTDVYAYLGRNASDDEYSEKTLKTMQAAVKERKKNNGYLTGYSAEYGYQLNGYRVIFDSEGRAAGLICVELDLSRITQEIDGYIRRILITSIILAVLMVLIYILIIRRCLTNPILRIVYGSNNFVRKMQRQEDPSQLVYEDPHIDSKSEIGLLADNVRELACGVSSYMRNLQEVTADRERLSAELSLATEIQDSVLPNIFPAFPEREEFDIYATMHPAREVGGDFYDFFLVDDDHLCMVMADVSGKGVPAALFMMSARIVLQNIAMMGKSPSEILTEANATLCINNTKRMFVTVWLGVLEISTGKLTAANAGHEYPAIRRGDGGFEIYKDKHGFVLGGMDGMKYKEYELMFKKGDALFIYTDGVPEATDGDHRMFGLERMLDALNRESAADPVQTLQNVRQAVDNFVRDAEQFDDLTMLCIQYKG
jgi:sigma-B regulation protein RsbU (phosphoserine phosphatase)